MSRLGLGMRMMARSSSSSSGWQQTTASRLTKVSSPPPATPSPTRQYSANSSTGQGAQPSSKRNAKATSPRFANITTTTPPTPRRNPPAVAHPRPTTTTTTTTTTKTKTTTIPTPGPYTPKPPPPPKSPPNEEPKKPISLDSPEYKEAKSKYISVMVALPILLVSSYMLYDRLINHFLINRDATNTSVERLRRVREDLENKGGRAA